MKTVSKKVRDGQTSPHSLRLVVSRSTCPPLSPFPHSNSFVIGTAVITTHTPNCHGVMIRMSDSDTQQAPGPKKDPKTLLKVNWQILSTNPALPAL